MSEKENSGRVYELGYLLVPTIAEGETQNVVEEIKKILVKAEVISEGNPEFIDLSYEMEQVVGSTRNRYTQGYFGWLKFEAEPETLVAIKKALDAMAAIIRYLLVKTEKDNAVIFKKPKNLARREIADETVEEAGEPLEEEMEEHEKLPELASDIEVETTTVTEKEEEQKGE